MWVQYNPNPIAARVIDCSIRALCRVTGKDWQDVYLEVCMLGFQMCDMPSSNAVWGAYLRKYGWRRYACQDGITIREFCRQHPRGKFVLCPSGHVVAAEDGAYFDTFDSGDNQVVYFWTKEER